MTDQQAERMIAAQERQAVALERFVGLLDAAVAPSEPPAATGCTHPEDWRSDFGLTDGRPDWQCRCGYRSLDQPADEAAQKVD